MSMGKLKRQSSSHKNRKREKDAAEALATANALATEQALARDFEDNLKRNRVVILVSIAVVVIGGAIYATQDSRTAAANAELTDLFREATMAAQGKVVSDSSPQTPDDTDADNPLATPSFESSDERSEAVNESFKAIVAKRAKSGTAHLAVLGLAANALQSGDGEAAAGHLKTFLSGEEKDTVFRRRALVMQAHALEAQGKPADGAQALVGLAKAAHDEVKRLAATAATDPSDAIDARLSRARERSAGLYIEAASMFRRAKMPDEAITFLKTVIEDENLKTSTERYLADEGLNILGQKGS